MLVIKLSTIDSTNAFLKQWVQQTKAHNAIAVRTEHQTHGTGRMGAKWHSEKGLNLLCSVYLGDISNQIKSIFEINKRVCLAILDTLKGQNIPELKIKWPNDILSVENKIGGVLVEPILRGNEITGVVIGCGINVNQLDFPNLPCASSLRKVTGKTHVIDPLFESLVKNIESNVRASSTDNSRYLDVLFGFNKLCSFKKQDGTYFVATLVGVDEGGKLMLKHEDETTELFEEKNLVFTAFSHC